MTATKQRKVSCVGYGDGAGLLHPCGSPALPVERSGRCIRCERLQRGTQLAHVDPFVSVNDMALPGEGAYREMVATALRPAAPVVAAAMLQPVAVEPEPVTVEAEPVAAAPTPEGLRWNRMWSACLLCGQTIKPHSGQGCCNTCHVRSRSWYKRGLGLTVLWLPFAGDNPTRYDRKDAERWVTVRDLAEAWRYLERRAAAGGITKRGKAVIRAASRAGELPETVIRRAA